MLPAEAGIRRTRGFRILYRNDIARLTLDAQLALDRTLALGQFQEISQMRMLAMPQDSVNALGGRPCRGNLPGTSGLCFIFIFVSTTFKLAQLISNISTSFSSVLVVVIDKKENERNDVIRTGLNENT